MDVSRFHRSADQNFTGNVTWHTVMKQKSLRYVKNKFASIRYFVTGEAFLTRVADLVVPLALGLPLRIAESNLLYS
jgi:hypothetical protein